MSASIRSATVRFGDTVALADVTVDIPDGRIVAVVGGDGAGKSTMLRALAREVALDSGILRSPSKSDIGYLPAGPGSWAALTVRENLDFVAGIYGLSGPELTERREAMIERAGLAIAADRVAAALSGGMRRKLAAAMAMIHRPTLLILDEPSTGVDPVSRIDLWRMISETAADGAAVIMSTTYLDEAERAAHLVILDDGHILTQGSFDDVRDGFDGTVTHGPDPVRAEWSWRRGRERHEYWPPGSQPDQNVQAIGAPDLEDIVIALSLRRQLTTGADR
ncbi:ABC transporter ATP-binding protein [Gordonia sp. CPCC 206044]|uniref:ABC transporter ATP-binding protein n=1 Tax=Gordonia sp. CPCC 206044 TaxID=3140793 RepID=UPI003AF3E142